MSVTSLEWKKLKQEMIIEYYNNLNELEKHKFKELNSIVVLQKNVRLYLGRKRFKVLKEIALEIQKNLKGYFAKDGHERNKQGHTENINKQFFEYHATIIQKISRGYLSRKNILNYAGRMRYLKFVSEKNNEMVQKLEENSRAIHNEREKNNEEETRKKFNDIGSKLHHLVSTKDIPGVYNQPNLPDEFKAYVYNADVETHLKNIFKMSFKKKNKIEPIPVITKIDALNNFNEKRRKLNEIKKNKSISNSNLNINPNNNNEKFTKTFNGKVQDQDNQQFSSMINNFEKKFSTTNYS